MTILDTLQKGTAYLEKHGIDEARLNMQHLLAHALRCERMQLYLDFDRPLDEATLETLRELTKRRGKGEPLQHLVGTVEFHGREFATDARALIPRPETEELVALLLKQDWPEAVRILDMGTGSGVIGLSLAAELSEKSPSAVMADISPEALELAAENRERLEISEDRVDFVCGGLFEKVAGEFDLIVANLPYIAAPEIGELSAEVQNDPETALAGGENGTELMVRFLNECGAFMKAGATVAMEFGAGQGEALKEVAEDLGFGPVEIRRDLSDQERFLFAVKSSDSG